MDKNPFFMMIKGKLEVELEDTDAGLKTLEKAFNLPGIQSGDFDHKKKSRYMTIISFNQNIRSQIYVEYAKALAEAKQQSKSKEIMEQAIMEFVGTDDEPVVLLGNADIAAINGDLKKAITILRAVEPEAKGYMEARKKLADIYLNKMMNRRQYAKCFFDLVQVFPNLENYKRYGDALLSIQEPDKAVEAYQEALKIDPSNQYLVRLIGKAYSITHSYQRAIQYYEDAINKHPKNLDLKLDQAKLLAKNNFLDKAEEMLDKETLMQESTETQTYEAVKRKVEALHELAGIYKKKMFIDTEDHETVVSALQEIWKQIMSNQLDAIERSKYEGGRPDEEKLKYADYCEMAAQLAVETDSQLDRAKEYYEDAIKFNPNKTELMLELAEIDFYNGDTDEGEQKCKKVLKSNPNHTWALKLLAECLINQGEIEKGANGFEKIYSRDPTNFIALGCLFDFYRRNGQLTEIKDILDRLEVKLGRSNEPGYCYVKGLYYYYRKNPNEALLNLYQAKRNTLYKNHSIKIMADIYLNPDQDLMFSSQTEKTKPIKVEYIECMSILLNELNDKYFGLEQQVYSTYADMYLKRDFAEANTFFTQSIAERENFVPAIIGLCVCKLLKGGKGSLDKNLLKVVSKSKFNAKWGEDSERGWIQVADFLITAGKSDLAERELHRCLKYNKSCSKAYELLGSIAELNNDTNGAASLYNQAWDISEKRDCSIGYRLATLYFKTLDYVNTVLIGKKVLL